MSNFNKVILAGHLSADPKTFFFNDNKQKTTFTIAINRKHKNGNGEYETDVSYIDCISWDNLAKNIKKFFIKGRPILIEGRLKQHKWEKDGVKKSKVFVIVEKFEFINSSNNPNRKEEPVHSSVANNEIYDDIDFDDLKIDELPF